MIPELTGQTIDVMRYNFSLMLWTSDNWEIDLAGATTLTTPDGVVHEIDTTLCQDGLTPDVQPLLHSTITAIVTADDGALTIEFSSGRVHVLPGDDHEAWQLAGPLGERVICVPGGRLVSWGPRSE